MPANPAIQTETLRVDFVVNDAKANAAKDKFVAGLKTAGTEIDGFGNNFGKGLQANLAASQKQVDELIRKIDAAKSRAGQLSPGVQAGRDAAAANARSADALSIVRGGSTGGRFLNQDPSVSAGARTQSRLNLGRQGADVFTTAAMGMDPLMIAIQQGPQVLDAMATSGLSLSKSALVTAGAFAGILAAGYLIVKASEAIRAEAERQLKVIEKIEASTNKQALALVASKDALAAARKERDAEAALADRLAGSNGELEKRKALLVQLNELNNLNRTESGVADRNSRNAEILKIEDELIKRTKDRQAAENEAFEQRNENFKISQKIQAEEAAAFAKSVDEAVAKINELAGANKTLFSELRVNAAGDNPFVKVFSDADKAIEKTRLTTATLKDELKAVADNLVATANANKLFETRQANALSISDLRADARRLREGGSQVQIDQQIADRLATIRRQEQGGLFRNPTFAMRQSFASASPGLRLELFDHIRATEESGGLFRNPLVQDAQRSALKRDAAAADQDSTARDRFNRQLEVINRQRPANDEQRAIADRAIIDLGKTLGDDASDSDRDKIAAAMERQAERLEKQESEAVRLRAEDRATNQNIDANIAALLKIAQSEGLTGTLRIINEAENNAKLSLGKRPTESDTKARSAN